MTKDFEWDAFICHASEDKDPFVLSLANALNAKGVHVWYDDFELRVGDSLVRKIDYGLRKSRYGIVVLSHSFFAKNFAQFEYDSLIHRHIDGGIKVILPVWHGINKEEIKQHSSFLADQYATQSDRDMDHVVFELIQAMEDVMVTQSTSDIEETFGLPTRIFDADLRHPKKKSGWHYRSRNDCDISCVELQPIDLSVEIIKFIDSVWQRVKEISPNAFDSTILFKVKNYLLLREFEEQFGRSQISLELSPTNYRHFKGTNDIWGFDNGKFAQSAYSLGLSIVEYENLGELQSSLLSNPLSVGCMVITRDSQNREYMGIANRNTTMTATSFRGYRYYVPCGGFVGRTPTKLDAETPNDPPSPFFTAAREFGEEVGTFDGINSPITPSDVTFFAFGRDMAANFEIGLCGEINCPFSHEELKNLRPGTDFLFEAQYSRRTPPIDWNVPVDPDAVAYWMAKRDAVANSWVPFGWTELVLTLVRRFGVADVEKALAPFITPKNRHLRMESDPQWTDKSSPRPDLLRRL